MFRGWRKSRNLNIGLIWFEISGIHSNGDVKKTAMCKMFAVQMRGPG